MRRGHVPERTCVGCRDAASKPTLLRIARDADGIVHADPRGRSPGRGAYIHRSDACLDRALRPGALDRALRSGVRVEEARKLRRFVEGMQGNA